MRLNELRRQSFNFRRAIIFLRVYHNRIVGASTFDFILDLELIASVCYSASSKSPLFYLFDFLFFICLSVRCWRACSKHSASRLDPSCSRLRMPLKFSALLCIVNRNVPSSSCHRIDTPNGWRNWRSFPRCIPSARIPIFHHRDYSIYILACNLAIFLRYTRGCLSSRALTHVFASTILLILRRNASYEVSIINA